MTDLPGDPNWLLSTVAQSSAVLIVFIGVLVVGPHFWATGHRRSLELRRLQVSTTLSYLKPRDNKDEPAGGAAAAVRSLESEFEALNAALRDLADSRPVWPSLVLLGYLAVVGLLLPLGLMPARSGAFDPGAHWSVAGLQLSGLAWKRLVLAGFAAGMALTLLQVAWTTLKTDEARKP